MRKRNNKINVFLSDEEKEILKSKVKKLKVNQSTYIRNLIINNDKENLLSKTKNIDVISIIKILEKDIEYLDRVKNKFHYLGYFNDEQSLQIKIEKLSSIKDNLINNLRSQ